MFKDAVLNREDPNTVKEMPLREIYRLILQLPNRKKFAEFFSTSGKKGSLSVSETFNYL
jgi:hypothetical protein